MFNNRLYIPRPKKYFNDLRNRSSYLNIDDTTIQGILKRYGSTLVKSAQPYRLQGRSNSLILSTSQGNLVLKQYVSSTTLPMITHEHSILRYLAHKNFPAPRLIATLEGETVVNLSDKSYAVFKFIEGGWHYNNYIWSPPQINSFIGLAGELLANLHSQLEDFSPEGQNINGFKSRTETWWRDLNWYIDNLSKCVHEVRDLKGANAKDSNFLMQNADWMAKSLSDLEHLLNTADLPRLIIHSDYGPYNLLFTDQQEITVLDFEIARLDWRLSEFIYAMPQFAHNNWFGFNFDHAKLFLDAYRRIKPLSNNELYLLPFVWQFLRIRKAIRCWRGFEETHTTSRLVDAANHLKWAKWALQNQMKLVNHLKAA